MRSDRRRLTDAYIHIFKVSRQLSNLSLSAQPPSYAQPQYYALSEYTYPSQTPAPYTEYATELNHLQSQHLPAQDGGYWENTRNDAVQYLSQPSHTYVPSLFNPNEPQYMRLFLLVHIHSTRLRPIIGPLLFPRSPHTPSIGPTPLLTLSSNTPFHPSRTRLLRHPQ